MVLWAACFLWREQRRGAVGGEKFLVRKRKFPLVASKLLNHECDLKQCVKLINWARSRWAENGAAGQQQCSSTISGSNIKSWERPFAEDTCVRRSPGRGIPASAVLCQQAVVRRVSGSLSSSPWSPSPDTPAWQKRLRILPRTWHHRARKHVLDPATKARPCTQEERKGSQRHKFVLMWMGRRTRNLIFHLSGNQHLFKISLL